MLGWCLTGSVLPHGEKVPLKPWLSLHPSSDGVMIKIPYGVDGLYQHSSPYVSLN